MKSPTCFPVSCRNRRPPSLSSSNSTMVPSVGLVLGRALPKCSPVMIGRESRR